MNIAVRLMFYLLFAVSICPSASAQQLKNDTLFLPGQFRQFQFQLEEPAESLEDLRYEKSGEPIKGSLSPDGKRVIMDNYKKGQRVKCTLVRPGGRREDYIKSPCFIDPVSYEL